MEAYPYQTPLIGRRFLRSDVVVILRMLALSARRGRPLEKTIADLSDSFPKSSGRRRLLQSRWSMEQGIGVWDSLRGAGVIGEADAVALQAAERVGNLPWALDEMSTSIFRRQVYQLRAWLNVLFPITVLIIGSFVGFFVVGLFIPILTLITGLV
jgi:type II secretory pathway component PulF